jgi:peptidoglycan/LPS O-acetylase OafA/YrhL
MNSAEKTLTRNHRFELLDALRGIGALFIATLHTPPTMQRLMPFRLSYLAVDLFFCLSGFVIAFSYEDRLLHSMTLAKFMLVRFIRLYPLYLLGLMIGLCAFVTRNYLLPPQQRAGSELAISFVLGLFMLPSLLHTTITTNAFPFNPPSWSLFFEIGINLIYAAALVVRRAGTALLLAVSLAALGFTLHEVLSHNAQFGSGWSADRHFFLGIPRITFSFLLGVVLFRLFRARPALRVPAHLHGVAGMGIVLATIFIFVGPFRFAESLGYQAAMISIVMPALIFVGAGVHVAPVFRKQCLFMGEVSYPLYILHLPLLSPLYFLQKLHVSGWAYQAMGPLSVVALAVVARWIGLHYDAPIRSLLMQRFSPSSTPTSSVATVALT